MFKQIERIEYVKNYKVNQSHVAYNDLHDSLFLDKRKIIEDTISYFFFKNKLCYHFGERTIFTDSSGDRLEEFDLIFNPETYFNNTFLVSKNYFRNKSKKWESDLFIYQYSPLKEIRQYPYNVENGLIREKDNFLQIVDGNVIAFKELETGQVLWQFFLRDLGAYEDIEGQMKPYTVDKFLGILNNVVLLACKGNLIIEINLNDGKIRRKWQELEGYGTTAFHGRLLNKMPSSYGFQLSLSTKHLFHLAGKYHVWIDLETGISQFTDLSSTLSQNNIKRFRWSTGYAEDETHIYTIGEMDEKYFGTDYIPQCILAYNKNTQNIEWCFRFENDGINTDSPQVSNDKLYQLTANGKLHVFQRES